MSIGPQHNGGILGATNNPTSTSAGGIWTPIQHYQAQRDGLWPVTTAPLPDYIISRSLRFNNADSAYLNRSFPVAGNTKTWTVSFWYKRSRLGVGECILFAGVYNGSNPNNQHSIIFTASDQIETGLYNNVTVTQQLTSTQVFRDISAWYHIILAYDTTQSVNTNRLKLYVNGQQVTSFATASYPALNEDGYICGSAFPHRIGRKSDGDANPSYYISGYLADFQLIDGQQLTPSSFGETDLTTGIWKPKAYSGSYGTNGFYLPFTDNSTTANLGVNTAQTVDELRNYTTLHLSGNPSASSGYNCFSDRSSNAHLLSASGEVVTSGRTPFSNDITSGSAYFNNGSYLQIPANSAFTLGTADYTVEGWFYFTNFNNQQLIGNISTGSDTSWAFYVQGSTLILSNWGTAAVSYATSNLVANTWYHLAVTRSNSLVRLFVNGNLVNSNTPASQNYSSTQTLYIGDDVSYSTTGPFTGYMSNLRVIKNQAVVTNTFTPSTSPLTTTTVGHTGAGAASSITGTVSLLTLVDKVGANNSGFIDDSANSAVITRSGNVTQGSFSPFGTSGWAMYQSDISGNYPSFTTSASTTFQFTGNFTVEGWVYPIIYSGTGDTSLWVTGGGSTYLALNYDGSGNYNIYLNSGVPTSTFASGITANTWNHVAMVRSGSTITLYTNGISRGTIQNSSTLGHANPTLARIGGGVASCSRYVSNLRIVKGAAVYSSNFIPSTDPLTAISGTVLLTCQDNRFVDNSSNNFTVTFTGTPQTQPLSPFLSHASTTKTYSNFFDGSNDSALIAYNAAFDLAASDFTIEGWIYTGDSSSNYPSIVGRWQGSGTACWDLRPRSTDRGNFLIFVYTTNGSTALFVDSNGPALSDNAWHHVVAVRSSSNFALFVDGTRRNTANFSGITIFNSASAPLNIGYDPWGTTYFSGYISNLRIVKGTAVYDPTLPTLSVPTAPLTAVTGTSLLTCQSNTFIDNSTNNFTITVNDTPRCTEFNPLGRTFTTGVNYLASTHGSSAYFDGTTDYLDVPSNAYWNFGDGSNFTIECWAYTPTAASSSYNIFSNSGTNSSGYTTGYIYPDGRVAIGKAGINEISSAAGKWPVSQWNHIAFVRSGSNLTIYVNGISIATTASASTYLNNATAALSIGRNYQTSISYLTGYVSSFRILKGTALYTSNFVPPMQPPQAVANTQLLLNFNNAGVVDYSGKNVLETVGDSRSVTSTKKSITDATGSMYFDGTGDYLTSPLNQAFLFSTNDFTVELWYYPLALTGTPGNNQSLVGMWGPSSSNISWLFYLTSGNLYWYTSTNGSTQTATMSAASGMSVNTWYHLALCRSNGTTRIFVNGTSIVSTTTSVNLFNATCPLTIGYNPAGGTPDYAYGHMQDLRITKFARYTGTFTPPTRTFSATVRDIGHKQWVANNFSVASGVGNDSLVDTPTSYGTDTGLGGEVRGNYCTLNPLWLSSSAPTLTNGNLDTTATNSTWNNVQATFGISSGKWYWESTMSGDMFFQLGVGLRDAINNAYGGSDTNSWTYDGRAFKVGNGSQPAYGATFAGGDVMGVALDMDAGTLTFYKNGASQGVAFSSGLAGKTVFPQFGCYQAGRSQSVNFGQRPFAYSAPTGYKALCTQNLPTPSIVKSNTAFDAVTYIGNGSTQTISTLNFNPDLVWIKRRDASGQDHVLQDVVRGFTSDTKLSSSSTAAENNTGGGVTDPQWGYVSAATNTGFTTTVGSGTGDQTNRSTWSYVAWNWDAGTSTVTNTAGSIQSNVRANTTAGFSIVTWTYNGAATIGHGLNAVPKFMIIRGRNAVYNWDVYHASIGATVRLMLNSTAATQTQTGPFNNTTPTSTVFSQGPSWYNNGELLVGYIFAEVAGYSSIGSYTGNGSADGPFVYCGFKPKFIILKASSVAATNWQINDTARDTFNVANKRLSPSAVDAEATNYNFGDILSNGFKIRQTDQTWNSSGQTYVYAAFAENPFKYSLAR